MNIDGEVNKATAQMYQDVIVEIVGVAINAQTTTLMGNINPADLLTSIGCQELVILATLGETVRPYVEKTDELSGRLERARSQISALTQREDALQEEQKGYEIQIAQLKHTLYGALEGNRQIEALCRPLIEGFARIHSLDKLDDMALGLYEGGAHGVLVDCIEESIRELSALETKQLDKESMREYQLIKKEIVDDLREAELVGRVKNYFSKKGVAGVELNIPLEIGDEIYIRGGDTLLQQKVGSMQIDHEQVEAGRLGNTVGILVEAPVRKGYKVYKMPSVNSSG